MWQSTATLQPANVAPFSRAVRRGSVRLVLALLAVSSLAPTSAAAFSDCARALRKLPLNVVEQAANVVPERVAGRELFGMPRSLGAREARFARPGAARLEPPQTVRRIIPRLWRMRVMRHVAPQQLHVSVRLAGAGNRLSGEDSRTQLPIRIAPLPPVVACRNEADQIIEGGAVVVVAPETLPMAGTYQGTIDVDVRLR